MIFAEKKTIRVLFTASEGEPFYKVGGLGDYSGSLPNALANLPPINGKRIDIRVALPLHNLDTIGEFSLEKQFPISITTKSKVVLGEVYKCALNNITYYFIRQTNPALNSHLVYGPDDHENAFKFIFFSLACIKMLPKLDWEPDIIHSNDWHTALIPYQIYNHNRNLKKQIKAKTLLAIHNMPFMGYGSTDILRDFNIEPMSIPTFPTWAQHLPLPMGIVAADEIVAVSPSYAEELKTKYFGYGLENYFIKNNEKLTGIINGIDIDTWNPAHDHIINSNYSPERLPQRVKNKKTLLREYGLNKNLNHPLLIVISRLENQKGIDLILGALTSLINEDFSAIILGSGYPGYERAFLKLEREHPGKIRSFIEYNSDLSKKLYASGDIILMPSIYEPCGLSQMIAMRYGCVPVAHAVGGLKDSIIEHPEKDRTGFLFEESKIDDFINCIHEALRTYSDKKKWESIQLNGMRKDFSWKHSAQKYAQLYSQILESR